MEQLTISIPLDNLKQIYLSMRDCSDRLGTGNITIKYWIRYLEKNHQDIEAIRRKELQKIIDSGYEDV